MNVDCPNTDQRLEAGVRDSGFGVQDLGFGVQGSGFSTRNLPVATRHSYRGFTLIELLVTITIISILAGITLGAIRYARSAAAESKTKDTIAKLNALVMQRYESYKTRRVPIDFSVLTVTIGGVKQKIPPKQAASLHYCALLDLMRMEMPERSFDISNGPLQIKEPDITTGPLLQPWTARPAISQMYLQKYNSGMPVDNCRAAKYLYMWISMTYPEAMAQFGQDEIADLDHDGWPVFVDGWGNPIMFLRWAPGFSSGVGLNPNPFNPSNPTQPRTDLSEIQTGDPINDHDPFDSRRIFPGNFSYPDYPSYYRLIPLIYSAGPDQVGHDINGDPKFGITIDEKNQTIFYGTNPNTDTLDMLNPYAPCPNTGVLIGSPDATPDHLDNIHNHRIEQQ